MSKFYGDFRAGQTVRCRFNTTSSAGVPTTLTSGAVIVSKDGSDVTPSGGVTLTADVGSVTGRHHVVIDTSVDATTFTAGSEYAVRLSGSSAVGGTSVVGIVVGEWSIANRAVAVDSSGRITLAAATHTGAVIPTVTTLTGHTPQTGDSYPIVNHATYGNAKLVRSTTPANTLDVSATGEAGIDWSNVGSPTTTVALSGTTVGTVTATGTATNLTNLPAAPTDWLSAAAVKADAVTKVQSGLATPTNITAGTITTVTTLTNLPAAPTDWLAAAAVKADAVTKIQAGLATPTNITAGTITTVTTLTNLPSAPTDWVTAAAVSAAAVTKIQAGMSTYAGGDTSGTTTLLARIPGTVQPQTGDAYARLGATPPTAGTVAAATWDLATSGHATAGTFGAAMAAAGTAGDPWIAAVPGSYPAGSAGAKLGGTLNANVVTVNGGTPVPADLNNVGLAPTGLDQISMVPEPGVPTTFRGLFVWMARRFYRSHKTPTSLVVENDAGASLTTQAVSDDGQGTESISAPT